MTPNWGFVPTPSGLVSDSEEKGIFPDSLVDTEGSTTSNPQPGNPWAEYISALNAPQEMGTDLPNPPTTENEFPSCYGKYDRDNPKCQTKCKDWAEGCKVYQEDLREKKRHAMRFRSQPEKSI